MSISNLSTTLGIPREHLPQIDFSDHELAMDELKKDGTKFAIGTVKCSKLKPSQDQLNVEKINKMIDDNQHKEDRQIFVSREGFIVDGHHGWAAKLTSDSDSTIGVVIVDLNIIDLLNWFNDQDFTFVKKITEGKKYEH